MDSTPAGSCGEALPPRWREALERADLECVPAQVRSVLESPELDAFLARALAYRRRVFPTPVNRVDFVRIEDEADKHRIGEFPVSMLDDRARNALRPPPNDRRQPSRIVWLSAENCVKQVINHGDLDAADYRRLPVVIHSGEMVREADGRHVAFFLEVGPDYSYKAVVEQTVNNEIFLTTFQKIRNEDVPRAKRRSKRAPRNASRR